jgi:glycosyltransferase involved in cell wall biosynthesis
LVLYVGGIDPHKNLEMLLHAMADLRAAAVIDWHLAIVGTPRADRALGPALVALRDVLGLSDHVTLTGFVPDRDLSILYNAAALLVQPSLDEGFGLPVIEAMACGVPVAVSNRGSLPALAGDAGLTFDPADRSEISQAIGLLLQDADLRRTLGARALARAADFTWTRSAGQLMELLQATGR